MALLVGGLYRSGASHSRLSAQDLRQRLGLGLGGGSNEADGSRCLCPWRGIAVLLAVEDGREVSLRLSLPLSHIHQHPSIEFQLQPFVEFLILTEMLAADIVTGVIVEHDASIVRVEAD
jgi:hypothetical protein